MNSYVAFFEPLIYIIIWTKIIRTTVHFHEIWISDIHFLRISTKFRRINIPVSAMPMSFPPLASQRRWLFPLSSVYIPSHIDHLF